jgi:hypothetical protein
MCYGGKCGRSGRECAGGWDGAAEDRFLEVLMQVPEGLSRRPGGVQIGHSVGAPILLQAGIESAGDRCGDGVWQ